jgi:RNA polymerase sigma-70 factor, ECF subfamily
VHRPENIPADRPSGCTETDFPHSKAGRCGLRIRLARLLHDRPRTAREEGRKVSPEDFTDFYAASFRRLVGQLYAMTGDRAEAEEAVQEAFVRAWSHRGRLDSLSSPEAYVRTTAWHIAVSRWQRARLGRLLLRSQPVPDVADGPGLDRVALIDALRKVPPEQRRALVLYHLCELTVAQIAGETGVPAGTVKARLARGRRALAPHLADSDRNWRITHG